MLARMRQLPPLSGCESLVYAIALLLSAGGLVLLPESGVAVAGLGVVSTMAAARFLGAGRLWALTIALGGVLLLGLVLVAMLSMPPASSSVGPMPRRCVAGDLVYSEPGLALVLRGGCRSRGMEDC